MTPEIRQIRRHLGVPTNARRAPHAHIQHEWDRRETEQPWMAVPDPLPWRDALLMVPAAIIVLAGLVAFCVLMFTLLPGPGQ